MYQLIVEHSAEKDLKRLSADIRPRVATALRSLATNPRPPGSRELAGAEHAWRSRAGDHRIIYEIADVIRVVRAANPSSPRGLSLMIVLCKRDAMREIRIRRPPRGWLEIDPM